MIRRKKQRIKKYEIIKNQIIKGNRIVRNSIILMKISPYKEISKYYKKDKLDTLEIKIN